MKKKTKPTIADYVQGIRTTVTDWISSAARDAQEMKATLRTMATAVAALPKAIADALVEPLSVFEKSRKFDTATLADQIRINRSVVQRVESMIETRLTALERSCERAEIALSKVDQRVICMRTDINDRNDQTQRLIREQLRCKECARSASQSAKEVLDTIDTVVVPTWWQPWTWGAKRFVRKIRSMTHLPPLVCNEAV
jgi:hypothetical protein